MFKKPIFYLFAGLALFFAFLWQLPDKKLHMVFCDVGQGDAALITYSGFQILVDGGPSDKVLDCLSEHMPFWDRQVEMVILTHPEADHLTGLISVIERYKIKQFVINAQLRESASFKAFFDSVVKEEASVYLPVKGDQIKIGSPRGEAGLVSLSFLWPKEKMASDLVWTGKEQFVLGTTSNNSPNDSSIVFKLSYGDFDALLTGDLPGNLEDEIKVMPAEVLKVAHHGSKNSSTLDFLERVKPELSIISVGKNNYGHPSAETLDRLEKAGSRVLKTLDGSIEIVTDGKSWYTKGQNGLDSTN